LKKRLRRLPARELFQRTELSWFDFLQAGTREWPAAREPHVFRFSQDLPRGIALPEVLDGEERRRASRYRFEKDRRAFEVTRATLRLLAGQYTARNPSEIKFHAAEGGKLFLDPFDGLHFNVSHSAGQSVIGFARREVGVDVEADREAPDYLDIAEHFFAQAEIQWLRALAPGAELQRGFLRLWTVKEAWLKATGQGLAIPLASVSVQLHENRDLHAQFPAGYEGRWTIQELPPENGFRAALAVESDLIDAVRLIEIGRDLEPSRGRKG
jgi:4'-phosphopantetheinyl transferase